MNLTKKIIGIFSIVISGFILFQSCASGVANALRSTGNSSGTYGVILVIFMLVGAILLLTTHGVKPMVVSAVFYGIAACVALLVDVGSFTDLRIWGWFCFIICVFLVIYSIIKS